MTRRSRRIELVGAWASVALALLLPSGTARAVDVVLGATSEYAYTSNFFSSPTDENAANSIAIGPSVEFSDDLGRFAYELGYNGAYQFYVDQSGVDAWEGFLRGQTSYEIDSRTTVRLTERFRDVSNLRFGRQDIALADTALDPNQNRYFRNDLELELIRELTSKLVLNLRGAHHWTDFRKNVNRNDSQAFDVASELRYRLVTNHDVGFGTAYLHQDFEEAQARLGSKSDSISTYLIWDWDIADNITFSASGGPAWIRSEYDNTERVTQNEFVGGNQDGNVLRANFASCNVDPGIGSPVASNCDLNSGAISAGDLGDRQSFLLGAGQQPGENSVVTGFGSATLLIDLASFNLQATYSRRQSTTSGAGLASSLDRVYTEIEFAPPNQRWSTFVAGSWDRREILTEATVVDFTVVAGADGAAQRSIAFTRDDNQAERRESLTAIAGVRTAFTRNQAATFEFRYRRTQGRDQGVSQPSADIFFAVLTFAYTLDPLRF